jgi:hypothetical protein
MGNPDPDGWWAKRSGSNRRERSFEIMTWTKTKTAIAVAVGVILLGGATYMLIEARARAVKYHALVAHAYTRDHVSTPAYRALLDDLRANVWPKERKLAEGKIAARQRKNDTVNATTIDLKPYVNAALTDSPASAVGNKGNNLSELPAGVNIYGGVPFDVEGFVQLGGKSLISTFHKNFPAKVDGIAIHKRCAKIYLLHAGDWVDTAEYGTAVARLVLHYEDGSQDQIDIVAGKDVFEFWSPLFTTGAGPEYSKMTPNTERAWTGSNRYIKQVWPDESLILYKSGFANPQPDLTVSTVDYVSTMTGAAPFMVGLTVE